MGKIIKSIGHGLLAAGILLVAIYFAGLYLKGNNALFDALNPLAMGNYLALAPLAPARSWFGWVTTLRPGVAGISTTDIENGGSPRPMYRGELLVQPDVLETPVVVDRVLVLDVTFEVGMPAGRLLAMEDDGPSDILHKDALDLPHDRPSFRQIGFLRLLVEQLVDLGIAVLREVRFRLAGKAHLQNAVRIVDAGTGEIDRDGRLLVD